MLDDPKARRRLARQREGVQRLAECWLVMLHWYGGAFKGSLVMVQQQPGARRTHVEDDASRVVRVETDRALGTFWRRACPVSCIVNRETRISVDNLCERNICGPDHADERRRKVRVARL